MHIHQFYQCLYRHIYIYIYIYISYFIVYSSSFPVRICAIVCINKSILNPCKRTLIKLSFFSMHDYPYLSPRHINAVNHLWSWLNAFIPLHYYYRDFNKQTLLNWITQNEYILLCMTSEYLHDIVRKTAVNILLLHKCYLPEVFRKQNQNYAITNINFHSLKLFPLIKFIYKLLHIYTSN